MATWSHLPGVLLRGISWLLQGKEKGPKHSVQSGGPWGGTSLAAGSCCSSCLACVATWSHLPGVLLKGFSWLLQGKGRGPKHCLYNMVVLGVAQGWQVGPAALLIYLVLCSYMIALLGCFSWLMQKKGRGPKQCLYKIMAIGLAQGWRCSSYLPCVATWSHLPGVLLRGFFLLLQGRGKGPKHCLYKMVLLLFLSTLCRYMAASSRGFVEGLLLAAARKGKGTKALPVQNGPAALPVYLVSLHGRIFPSFVGVLLLAAVRKGKGPKQHCWRWNPGGSRCFETSRFSSLWGLAANVLVYRRVRLPWKPGHKVY